MTLLSGSLEEHVSMWGGEPELRTRSAPCLNSLQETPVWKQKVLSRGLLWAGMRKLPAQPEGTCTRLKEE